MGNTTSAISGTATLDSFIGELNDISFEKSLSSSRFLKCVRGRHKDGPVVVKLFVKAPNVNLAKYIKQSEAEKDVLLSIPNALSYQRIQESDKAVYLVRQYNASNLYDRVSMRPFLEAVEKRWIVFQLLTGLKDCHARGIRHGDIKTENVLVTSWNWVYLTDFAFFKPTYLPENNPADFSYYFDTSFRRTCYLAPERFYGSMEVKTGALTDAMDIFSLGCVIAELFLEGSALFDLSQLFKYKTGEYDPRILLEKIDDLEIRSLISHMINLDPEKRLGADQYLQKWQKRAFPQYFSTFLHEYLSLVTDAQRHHLQVPSTDIDDTLDRIFFDFDKISFFLKFDDGDTKTEGILASQVESHNQISIPNYKRAALQRHKRTTADDGALIFLSIVLSGVRNTTRAITRVRACDTILALSDRTSDEAKLDRVVPFLVSLISDEATEVRAIALTSLTQVLATVQVLTPVNAFVFPEYVLHKLREKVFNSPSIVRIKYAQCIATLARTAKSFADMAQALRNEDYLTLVENGDTENQTHGDKVFDTHLEAGRKDQETYLRQHVLRLLADEDPAVKRALLPSIADMTSLFGNRRTNDLILGYLISYLNDRDWLLKAALFDNLASLCNSLGRQSVELYIVPLLIQAMTDPEEFILEKALNILTFLCHTRLIVQPISTHVAALVVRYFVHPNLWIREAVTGYITTLSESVPLADQYCLIYPLVRPFLRRDVSSITSAAILQSLRRPLINRVFETALKSAMDNANSRNSFWQMNAAMQDFTHDASVLDPVALAATFSKVLSVAPGNEIKRTSMRERISNSKSSEDDVAIIAKLRIQGLRPEDDGKLTVLKEYMARTARRKQDLMHDLSMHPANVNITSTPTTVFFDTFQQGNVNGDTAKRKHDSNHDVHSALRDATLNLENGRVTRSLRRVTAPVVQSSTLPVNSGDQGRRLPTANDSQARVGLETSRAPDRQQTTLSAPQKGSTSNASTQNQSAANSIDGDSKTSFQRQISAVNLPGVSSKAQAAVSTTTTIAVGQVDHQCNDTPDSMRDPRPKYQSNVAQHDYRGTDQAVLDALECAYLSTYPQTQDLYESNLTMTPRRVTTMTEQNWKAETVLVAHMQEHAAAINCVRVSPDHLFFVTCSDDGTIKVWDSGKLERNVANRARLTYRGLLESRIKSICFLENSHCIAAASDQGVLHILKIECEGNVNGATKYGSIRLLNRYALEAGENVSAMKHMLQGQQSLLILATSRARMLALDLMSMSIAYEMQNPPHHGSLTTICIDEKRTWLVVGTSCGILDLWDLRFQLLIKSIGLPHHRRVTSLCVHPKRGKSRWICVATAGTPEISVWDIEKSSCRERYRPHNCTIESDQQPYQAWDVESSTPEQLMARTANEMTLGNQERNNAQTYCRAMVTAGDASSEGQGRGSGLSLVCATTDQLLRRWDLEKIQQSVVISGLKTDEEKPTFQSLTSFQTDIKEEIAPKINPNIKPKKKNTRPSAPNMQQNHLLRSHMDTILDVAYLQWPYKMIVSVDRSGIVKVFA